MSGKNAQPAQPAAAKKRKTKKDIAKKAEPDTTKPQKPRPVYKSLLSIQLDSLPSIRIPRNKESVEPEANIDENAPLIAPESSEDQGGARTELVRDGPGEEHFIHLQGEGGQHRCIQEQQCDDIKQRTEAQRTLQGPQAFPRGV